MSAVSIVPFMHAGLLAVMGGFGLLLVYRMLTGQIRLDGILSPDGAGIDPMRLQMIAVTLGALGAYIGMTLGGGTDGDPPTRLADVPDWLLAVLAGSHSTYLAGKVVGART